MTVSCSFALLSFSSFALVVVVVAAAALVLVAFFFTAMRKSESVNI